MVCLVEMEPVPVAMVSCEGRLTPRRARNCTDLIEQLTIASTMIVDSPYMSRLFGNFLPYPPTVQGSGLGIGVGGVGLHGSALSCVERQRRDLVAFPAVMSGQFF
jgi:hypothetical protein